ncbi:nitrite reductase [Streptomyces radicis]|uniref:Nitrite reductase n=1 Tax=Streptomyces radicis TaxID=1750517 RepID=A0A3A9WAN1_9ACTN|nr:nitrite reductase [Streptomyces radicis]RKN15612.1 nitrite reductase [Streptomyces radicis]
MLTPHAVRGRPDRCPGALRPWPADDGLLVRLRLVGGRLPARGLRALLALSERWGDGRIHLTSRANVQVRGLPSDGGALAPEVLAAVEATGLLPSRSHELVRNVMVSPGTGLAGGRADLRGAAAELDAALLARARIAHLPGRFLFVLDDGRGDLVDRPCDLGLVALNGTTAQLRIGDGWGPVTPLGDAVGALTDLALAFLRARGEGPAAPWHVRELAVPLVAPVAPDPGLPPATAPLPYGDVPGGRHVEVADGALTRGLADELLATGVELVVTPWHGVLVPAPEALR